MRLIDKKIDDELIEIVASRMWFEYVGFQGYPNGMSTWSELTEETYGTKAEWRAMAVGAIEAVMIELERPVGDDAASGAPTLSDSASIIP